MAETDDLGIPLLDPDHGDPTAQLNNYTLLTLQALIGGAATVNIAGSDAVNGEYVVGTIDGDEKKAMLFATGALTGNRSMLEPIGATAKAVRKVVIWNLTTGAYTLSLKRLGQSSYVGTVPQNYAREFFRDGTNWYPKGPAFDPLTGALYGGTLTVRDEDGTPSVSGVTQLRFPNSSVTDNGSGSVSITFPAGVGTVPAARVRRTTNQSIPNGVVTAITFDAEDWDNNSIHSTVSNTSRLVLNQVGLWRVYTSLRFAANANPVREVFILRNGDTSFRYGDTVVATSSASSPTDVSLSHEVKVTAITDYVEVYVYHEAGSALDIVANLGQPSFGCSFIGTV